MSRMEGRGTEGTRIVQTFDDLWSLTCDLVLFGRIVHFNGGGILTAHPDSGPRPPGPKTEAEATVVAPLPQKDGGKEGDDDDEEEGLIPVGVVVGSRACSPA